MVLSNLLFVSDILDKLPETFKYDEIRKRYGIEVQPTTVVLLQELQRFNSLVARMRLSIVNLRRVRKRRTKETEVLVFHMDKKINSGL